MLNGDKRMDKMKIRVIARILLVSILIGCCGVGFLGYKLYIHENKQTSQIYDLMGQVSYLENKLNQTTNYYNFETEYKADAFNYFAIGNSLTLITSWGRGICSTEPDNDYFNLVRKSLENRYGKVVAYPYNFSPWERLSNRDKAFDLIESYLSPELDLVTVQLGENATDITTYEQDLESLVNYVKEKAPDATILIIGDWWSTEKNEMRKEAAKNTGALFADLSNAIGDSSYQSQTGLTCYLIDGSTIEVSEEASTHPGDKGMKYIADQIEAALGFK